MNKMIKALPETATAQVRAQKARLEGAKEVSMKEKGLYKTVSSLLSFEKYKTLSVFHQVIETRVEEMLWEHEPHVRITSLSKLHFLE